MNRAAVHNSGQRCLFLINLNREWTRMDTNHFLLFAFIRSDSTELAEVLSAIVFFG
jgi:hypothetical protein